MINLQLNHTTLFSCMKPQNQNMDLFIYFLTVENNVKLPLRGIFNNSDSYTFQL